MGGDSAGIHEQVQGPSSSSHGTEGTRRDLDARLGLTVPHEWWPSAPLVKSFEAAGFVIAQIDSPPCSVLSDPRLNLKHADAVRAEFETTKLASIVHAPGGLRVGSPTGDRAMTGLLDYATELGAGTVVYHALALPNTSNSEQRLRAECRSLTVLARYAASVGATIAIENLAPLFPGPETVSASPMALRGLVRKMGSEGVGLCLDLGHANITAGMRRTDLRRLLEPVLDQVVLFHAHDNLGARRESHELRGVDPLRLDLHLPPGDGSLRWDSISDLINTHRAPVVLEIHPPHRPAVADLFDAALLNLG